MSKFETLLKQRMLRNLKYMSEKQKNQTFPQFSASFYVNELRGILNDKRTKKTIDEIDREDFMAMLTACWLGFYDRQTLKKKIIRKVS